MGKAGPMRSVILHRRPPFTLGCIQRASENFHTQHWHPIAKTFYHPVPPLANSGRRLSHSSIRVLGSSQA